MASARVFLSFATYLFVVSSLCVSLAAIYIGRDFVRSLFISFVISVGI